MRKRKFTATYTTTYLYVFFLSLLSALTLVLTLHVATVEKEDQVVKPMAKVV
jgi:hypothetical protein